MFCFFFTTYFCTPNLFDVTNSDYATRGRRPCATLLHKLDRGLWTSQGCGQQEDTGSGDSVISYFEYLFLFRDDETRWKIEGKHLIEG